MISPGDPEEEAPAGNSTASCCQAGTQLSRAEGGLPASTETTCAPLSHMSGYYVFSVLSPVRGPHGRVTRAQKHPWVVKPPLLLFLIKIFFLREPSYIVGGNVSWCGHYGKRYGGSSKNEE